MPKQDYKINTANATAGQLYGLQQTRADIQTRVASTSIGFGLGLTDVVLANVQRGVALATGGKVSVSVRQINRTMEIYSTTGDVSFKENTELPALYEGRIVVTIADGADGAYGDVVGVDAGVFTLAGTATTNVTLGHAVDASANLYEVVVTNSTNASA